MIRKNWKEWLKCCNNKKKRTVTLFCTFNSIFTCKKKKKRFPLPRGSKLNSTQQHLQTLSCFIYSFFPFFPTSLHRPAQEVLPPPHSWRQTAPAPPCDRLLFPFFFFFFYGRGWVTLVCSTARDWLLAAPLSLCCPGNAALLLIKLIKKCLGMHLTD